MNDNEKQQVKDMMDLLDELVQLTGNRALQQKVWDLQLKRNNRIRLRKEPDMKPEDRVV